MKIHKVRDLKIQYGMYLGLPPDAREPKEQKEFAKVLGVTEQTLSHWKNDPVVKEAERNALQLFAQSHDLNVMKSMIEKAEAGSYQHQQLYWKWRGQLAEKPVPSEKKEPQEIKVTFVKVAKPTDSII